jgi:hypothetical protein
VTEFLTLTLTDLCVQSRIARLTPLAASHEGLTTHGPSSHRQLAPVVHEAQARPAPGRPTLVRPAPLEALIMIAITLQALPQPLACPIDGVIVKWTVTPQATDRNPRVVGRIGMTIHNQGQQRCLCHVDDF